MTDLPTYTPSEGHGHEVKCPKCTEWSISYGKLDDVCTHCGGFLKEKERNDVAEKKEKERKLEFNFKESWPFTVKEDDNILIVATKKVGYGLYFVFMSIMATFLWIIFWLAS